MSMASLANIITIHEKVVTLIAANCGRSTPCRANTPLQSMDPDSLYLSDANLRSLLDGPIRSAFGVAVAPKNLKKIINGLNPTVGDLSIAIYTTFNRQHRAPRMKLDSNPHASGAAKALAR
jgi:hypothetical protein